MSLNVWTATAGKGRLAVSPQVLFESSLGLIGDVVVGASNRRDQDGSICNVEPS